MKKTILLTLLIMSHTAIASWYDSETLTWTQEKDWVTFDQELKTFYRFLPMTEKAHDYFTTLDRRYNHKCELKIRDIRNLFAKEEVVIGVYAIKDCIKTGPNLNWK